MRKLLGVVLIAACGGGMNVDGGQDSGVDAGTRSSYVCSGFSYCRGADGGPDAQPFSRSYCVTYEEQAESAFDSDGPPAKYPDGGACVANHACKVERTDAGASVPCG